VFLILQHCRSLQTDRINCSLLEKIISSSIVISDIRHIFVGIDSTEFKITRTLQYYTDQTGFKRKYAKLSIEADVLQQIICNIKISELQQDMIIQILGQSLNGFNDWNAEQGIVT
jgi:hypothetical protein